MPPPPLPSTPHAHPASSCCSSTSSFSPFCPPPISPFLPLPSFPTSSPASSCSCFCSFSSLYSYSPPTAPLPLHVSPPTPPSPHFLPPSSPSINSSSPFHLSYLFNVCIFCFKCFFILRPLLSSTPLAHNPWSSPPLLPLPSTPSSVSPCSDISGGEYSSSGIRGACRFLLRVAEVADVRVAAGRPLGSFVPAAGLGGFLHSSVYLWC